MVAKIEGADARGFEVWPENWPIVEAFLLVSTQWRMVNRGGGMQPMQVYYTGLDYAAAAAGLAAAGVSVTPATWHGLRIMEAAARNTLNGVGDID